MEVNKTNQLKFIKRFEILIEGNAPFAGYAMGIIMWVSVFTIVGLFSK